MGQPLNRQSLCEINKYIAGVQNPGTRFLRLRLIFFVLQHVTCFLLLSGAYNFEVAFILLGNLCTPD